MQFIIFPGSVQVRTTLEPELNLLNWFDQVQFKVQAFAQTKP
jgi:hypothetical protein